MVFYHYDSYSSIQTDFSQIRTLPEETWRLCYYFEGQRYKKTVFVTKRSKHWVGVSKST